MKVNTLNFQAIAKQYGADSQIAKFPGRPYPFYYGDGLINHLGKILREFNFRGKVLLVSNPNVKSLFEKPIENSLKASDYAFTWALMGEGEKYKTLETVSELYKAAATAKMDKGSIIVAIGGGVVQDVANYVACTYMRGVAFVQIPTTVLGQADIGIGGCAIDHPLGKSIIGQFYQPKLAILDSSVLKTLSKYEITNGLAEIINKVACLGGLKVNTIANDIQKIKAGDWKMLGSYILLSNKIKKKIIEADENGSKGTRILLDWGHTITHALEKTLNYTIPHGIALGIGMHGAIILSAELGHVSQKEVDQLYHIIKVAELPTHLPSTVNLDHLIANMALDQKVREGKKRFILLKGFGKAFISEPIDEKVIANLLKRIQEKK
ncbi:MAG: 3-dehydroquinate synthase family protein [Nanoarchaeota archaeon]